MKVMLVCLLAMVAVANAQDLVEGSGARSLFNPFEESEAEILSNEFLMDDQGGYSSKVTTSNKISQSSTGESVPGAEPETGSFLMSGEYSYIAPDGQLIKVTWYADDTGFHPTSDSIPTAPVA